MRVKAALLLIVVATGSSRGDDSPWLTLPAVVQAALKTNESLFSNVLITGERSRRPFAPVETVLEKRAELRQAGPRQLRLPERLDTAG